MSGIAALAEPARRTLYDYVAAQPEPVGREQAAAATGIAAHNVRFHLDRLVEEGLLEVEYRRLSGRRGPGAGRPAKLYRRAAQEISVSLPARRYDLAGQVLAAALESAAAGAPVPQALSAQASAAGRDLAADASGSTPMDRVVHALAANGYEPRVEADRVVMANCPFHTLAQRHTELVCGLNHALITGLAEAVEAADLLVLLDPAPGRCCVTLAERSAPDEVGGPYDQRP